MPEEKAASLQLTTPPVESVAIQLRIRPSQTTMPYLWDEVFETEWRSTPYIAERQATEEDVLAGIAVFSFKDNPPPQSLTCHASSHNTGKTAQRHA